MTWSHQEQHPQLANTPQTSCLGEKTRCKRNTLLSIDGNCALQFHPDLIPKPYVCNSSLYHKFYGEEKTFILCLSDVGRQSSQGKGQCAASTVGADSLQESASEMCFWSPNWGTWKYLHSAENQNRGLVAEPKAYGRPYIIFFLRGKTE